MGIPQITEESYENLTVLLEKYAECRSQRDTDSLKPLMHESMVYEDPQLPSGSGTRDDYLQLLGELWRQCSELSISPWGDPYIGPNGAMVQRWLGRGKVSKIISGSADSRIEFELVELYEFRDGLISRLSIFQRSLI